MVSCGQGQAAFLARLVLLAAAAACAEAHGRLTVPAARNGNDNGAVGGGPGSVHAFAGDGQHSKYEHGICGNAAGVAQSYNRVGEAQVRYTAGQVAEFKVTITAHHVGYFEFELCDTAGELSETCFMQHRLLREGCQCSCGSDPTHSCAECEACRRWWKPLLEGELSQTVTSGYAGPVLPGAGNLVPVEYTMRFVIPVGVKTSRGVLRWHYMTTNSCTGKTSAPEEFWNCADVEVSDGDGDVGGELPFDNTALEGLVVSNLVPAMESGGLMGVNSVCPEDSLGSLLGVGAASEYDGLCGDMVDGVHEDCKDLSVPGSGGADCTNPPESGILCAGECSDSWFQCHNGVAYTKPVAAGTRCKGNDFVVEAECAGWVPEPAPMPTPMPTPVPTPVPTTMPTPAPSPTTTEDPNLPPPIVEAPASTTAPMLAPTPAPTTGSAVVCTTLADCRAHDWCDQAKYEAFCSASSQAGTCPQPFCTEVPVTPTAAPTTMPTPMPTPVPKPAPTPVPMTQPTPAPTSSPRPVPTPAPAVATTPAPSSSACDSCSKCLWSGGQCYTDVDQAYCEQWVTNTWCGGSALAQVKQHRFRGLAGSRDHALIQEAASVERRGQLRQEDEEL